MSRTSGVPDRSVDGISVFAGQSHPELAKGICAHLGIHLAASTFTRFSNDNLYVKLDESVRGKDVFIVQTLVAPVQENLFELFLLLDAAHFAAAGRVTAVVPYYSYARSDKKDEPRISIAARLVADLLETAGADRVVTMTLHSAQVHGFFRVPSDHLDSIPVLAEAIRQLRIPDAVVVAPDIGGAKRATYLARRLGLPVAAGNKKRIDDRTVEIDGLVGNVNGENAIIADDEISRGTSVEATLDLLRDHGVKRAWVTSTHGVFTDDAVNRLSAIPEIQKIVVTDTVPQGKWCGSPKLQVASIAPLFAEAIRRIHQEESVSSIFTPV